ncbi:ATP-grasp domain-containing protein [Nocardioides pakistanensis]
MSASTLVVVTQRRWLADDFAAVADRLGLRIAHSFGLDVPVYGDDPRDVAWWAPTEWAARALQAGCDMTLTAPGPHWLGHVPAPLLGRRVASGPLSLVGEHPAMSREGWWKPAEFKVEAVPAAWRSAEDFKEACLRFGLPADADVQWSEPLPRVVEEHRVFVLDRQPVTSSPYLIDAATWHEQMRSNHDADAHAFATDVCAALAGRQPKAYVLDIALTAAGEWFVLEANPAWSSAPYGADVEAVLDVVLAANRIVGGDDPWRWRPDAYLVQRAARQRRLVLAAPASA